MEKKLYKIDDKGRTRLWICRLSTEERPGVIVCDGLMEGKIKDGTFKKAYSKNAGKSNMTTAFQQSKLMFEQEVSKKLKNGYFETIEEAKENVGTFAPMLCPSGMKWKDWAPSVKYPAFVSPKLDGARCIAMLVDGKVVLKTRTGKIWKNAKHIEEALFDPLNFYGGSLILDGELYNHSFKDNFEDLMSIIKKEKPSDADIENSKQNLQYHIYDYYDKDEPFDVFAIRNEVLIDTINELSKRSIISVKICKSKMVNSEKEFDELHEKALSLGYEGTILRLNAEYEPGKRSKFMLKRKEVYDVEAEIVTIIEGEGTKSGICGKMTIKLDDGTIQEAGLGKGINDTKAWEMLINKNDYEGKRATFQYFGYTNGGKLRFPKFMRLRETLDM